MGTTLTGTTPQDTYDSLIKVTDNGPLSGSLKKLTDGLGNDSALSLSTSAASIAGTLGVTGTMTLGNAGVTNAILNSADGMYLNIDSDASGSTPEIMFAKGRSGASGGTALMTITNAGNVGIGTSSPASLLTLQPANDAADSLRIYRGKDSGFQFQSAIIDATSGNVNIKSLASDAVRWISFQLSTNSGSSYTQAARIDLDGLKFGSDTAAANALDDYEEGTWTMGISFGGASVGVTTTNNTGTYTKIGRQVTVNGVISLSNKGSSSGTATITGLPFTIANSNPNFATASLWLINISFANQFQAYGNKNTTTIVLTETTSLGVVTDLSDADFANNSEVMVNFTYFV